VHQSPPFFAPPRARLKAIIAAPLKRSLTRVIALSSEAVRDLEAQGFPRSRIRVVPNGVDCARFDSRAVSGPDIEAVRLAADAESGIPLIGALTRLHPLKGLEDLFEAFAEVRAERPKARLAIAGGLSGDAPTHGAELKALGQRLGILDATTFFGHLDDPRPFLCACDVVVQPSRLEASPLSVLEALALEKRVVGTLVGGVPSLLGGGRWGALVPPSDPAALANAIADQLEPGRLSTPLEAGRSFVEEHYSLSRSLALLGAVIAEVAPSRDRTPQEA
jgi:glycosyltransferase involved in cell wall biosynthesis